MRRFLLPVFLFAFLLLGQGTAYAATAQKFEIGGWIPYWRTATGTADVLPHLDQLTEVSPFVLTLKSDGTIFDAGKLNQEPWVSFIAAAKAKKVRVIPTIMSGNGTTIHNLLSNQKTRIALEDRIANLVKENGWDGIDIDFEAKKAETIDYFSTFLKGLYQRMGNKWVYCAIESRTPVEDRYDNTPPADARQYANDYVALNKYCDRVELMTYDQGTVDRALNKARFAPYVPVADPTWVERVVTLATQQIAKKKILIGIPTYGYEYAVTPLSDSGYRYDVQWAFNPRYATELAASLGITPKRNSSNEMSFTYTPVQVTPPTPSETTGAPPNVPTTTFAQDAFTPVVAQPFNVVWWSDAQAIADKVALAKRLGVKGVAVFKFDGGEDSGMWSVLK